MQVGPLFTTLRTPFPIRDTGVLGQIETGFRTLSAAAVKSLAFCMVKVQVGFTMAMWGEREPRQAKPH